MVRLNRAALIFLPLAAAGCNKQQPQANQTAIEVRGPEQERLHKLDAVNLAIALKRAIFDLGYRCQRIDKAGFVARYENTDMWMAHCNDGRDWAIFAGPDGSAQVRDCQDLGGTGIPPCKISELPKGNFEGEPRKATRAQPLPG